MMKITTPTVALAMLSLLGAAAIAAKKLMLVPIAEVSLSELGVQPPLFLRTNSRGDWWLLDGFRFRALRYENGRLAGGIEIDHKGGDASALRYRFAVNDGEILVADLGRRP